jgi:hypothetical protein
MNGWNHDEGIVKDDEYEQEAPLVSTIAADAIGENG